MAYPVIEITKDTTDQELFDAVVTHMLGMDGPCEDERGHCAYRGPGGTACAVGALLPDSALELYDDVISEFLREYKAAVYASLADEMPELDRLEESEEMLTFLQLIHDKGANWDGGLSLAGVEDLLIIAGRYDLKAPQALLDKREELKA